MKKEDLWRNGGKCGSLLCVYRTSRNEIGYKRFSLNFQVNFSAKQICVWFFPIKIEFHDKGTRRLFHAVAEYRNSVEGCVKIPSFGRRWWHLCLPSLLRRYSSESRISKTGGGGATKRGGTPTYYLANFCCKLDENEDIWAERGRPLYQPMHLPWKFKQFEYLEIGHSVSCCKDKVVAVHVTEVNERKDQKGIWRPWVMFIGCKSHSCCYGH